MNAPADRASSAAVLFLRPGQWWFGGRADGVLRVATVLGSCVAVTLWHARLRCGGMCHFVLPRREAPASKLDGRYGDEALALMDRAMARHGTNPSDYETGLFGAANMFFDNPKVTIDVGACNAAEARSLLAQRGMVARHESLLGNECRHLSLDMADGRILLRAGNASGHILEPRP